MKQILKKLFPICRSITGNGFLKSLNILKKELKQLKIKNFSSGKKYLIGRYQQNGMLKMHMY